MRHFLMTCTFVVASLSATAQAHGARQFRVKGNIMYITLSRDLSVKDIDEFTNKYNIAGIGLHQLIQSGKDDSLQAMGWTINMSQPDVYIIQKPLPSYGDIHGNRGSRIIFTPIPTPDDWHIVGGNKLIYGYNDFGNKKGFNISGDTVYFVLNGFKDAKTVRLAGNFTNWQHGAFPMTKNDSGWSVAVKLKPGPWYYKFIVDENDWMTDPDNEISENDGRGNENSLFYVPNRIFTLKGYENATNVFLAGSFNNWTKNKLHLEKVKGGWQISLYIEPGTYKYSYYVDGVAVPGSDAKGRPLEFSFGDEYTFSLKGFVDAKKVMLAGDFNEWAPDEIAMKKTPDGWEASYALGPGNYQYKFIVDDRWITDPANPQKVNDGRGNINSYLVIGANFTFHLKGHADAKAVRISGDFNDWSAEGLPMTRSGNEWTCSVHLAKGKHLYRFSIDGEWRRDPANQDWETDENGRENSVIWVQ
ncbi:MAG: hypothetical protein JST87_05590 [Bacteroidetes bacterium]|nr:hypothetical protein [Bacteroidota bacterium]